MNTEDPPCIIELKSKCVHARKRHKCEWRTHKEHHIEKGEAYQYVVYLDEDMKFMAVHVCYECWHGYKPEEEIE